MIARRAMRSGVVMLSSYHIRIPMLTVSAWSTKPAGPVHGTAFGRAETKVIESGWLVVHVAACSREGGRFPEIELQAETTGEEVRNDASSRAAVASLVEALTTQQEIKAVVARPAEPIGNSTMP